MSLSFILYFLLFVLINIKKKRFCVIFLFETILIYLGRYDPPSGWKVLLEPDSEMRRGPRSLGDEDNTDWLPLGQQNLPDLWSGPGGKTLYSFHSSMGMALIIYTKSKEK